MQDSRTMMPLIEGDVAEDGLRRLYRAEVMLSDSAGQGLTGIISAVTAVSPRPQWLLDQHGRMVVCTSQATQLAIPDLSSLLDAVGQPSPAAATAHMVLPNSTHGIARRYLVTPVGGRTTVYGWCATAELPYPFDVIDRHLAERIAHHLGVEYDIQHRVARACWNAQSMLARQLIHGSGPEDELIASADYLGVKLDAARVVVFIGDPATRLDVENATALSASITRCLHTEVLCTRGSEGSVLLIEVPGSCGSAEFVDRVKSAVRLRLSDHPDQPLAIGVSMVTDRAGLRRAYREAREVARCVNRFGGVGSNVVGVDDLGPARLFLSHADKHAVHSYVSDVFGPLLDELPGTADLLRTMQVYSSTGHSVRATSRRMGIHENTVRLRLARVRRLTGLDLVADANHQLTTQTALLVLQLGGHPALEGRDTDACVTRTSQQYGEKDAV